MSRQNDSNSASRARPKPWHQFQAPRRLRWLAPFWFADWLLQWVAYGMSHFALLEVLEYCGSFSVLVAVIFYFLDAPERTKTKHYQAWQVINTAQGKGGSGGRTDALRELNEDHVPLVGVDVSDAFLQGLVLTDASLLRSRFASADLRNASFAGSSLAYSDFASANLRGANLSSANLSEADFNGADCNAASLAGVNLTGVNLDQADLRNANLLNATHWQDIASIALANIHGVQNAPAGFVDWAIKHGAVDIESDKLWEKKIDAEKK